jgi:hypothetical protein
MKRQRLVKLPTEQTLMHQVNQALDEVSRSKWSNITHHAIASAIAKRLKKNRNIQCFSRTPRRKSTVCDGTEFLFDFCALLYEKQDAPFYVQALVVGETEWKARVTDDDFEKLLIVDSVVCFFVFEEDSDEKANKKLEKYEQVAELRREYAKRRGARPPRFLLACYVKPDSGALRSRPLTRKV